MDTLDLAQSYVDNLLVVMHSPDGQANWQAIPLEKVPLWVRRPDVIQNLLHGNRAASNPEDPAAGFFTIIRVAELDAVKQAGPISPTQH